MRINFRVNINAEGVKVNAPVLMSSLSVKSIINQNFSGAVKVTILHMENQNMTVEQQTGHIINPFNLTLDTIMNYMINTVIHSKNDEFIID